MGGIVVHSAQVKHRVRKGGSIAPDALVVEESGVQVIAVVVHATQKPQPPVRELSRGAQGPLSRQIGDAIIRPSSVFLVPVVALVPDVCLAVATTEQDLPVVAQPDEAAVEFVWECRGTSTGRRVGVVKTLHLKLIQAGVAVTSADYNVGT